MKNTCTSASPIILCSLCLLIHPSAASEFVLRQPTLVADQAHSSLQFRTRHWGIVDVIGWFEDFEVLVYAESGDFSDAIFEARVRPASIRMPNPDMARNVVSMFDIDSHPEATFRSARVEAVSEDVYRLSGEFRMNGVSHDLSLEAHFNGYSAPPSAIPGFTIRGELDRLQFGLGDLELLPGNQKPIIGRTIEVICNLRLIVPGSD